MSVRVIDMNESDLRKIVRDESDLSRKIMEVVDKLPPMRTADAAAALEVTPKTINQWRKEHKIKSVQHGRIPVSEVIRLKMENVA